MLYPHNKSDYFLGVHIEDFWKWKPNSGDFYSARAVNHPHFTLVSKFPAPFYPASNPLAYCKRISLCAKSDFKAVFFIVSVLLKISI